MASSGSCDAGFCSKEMKVQHNVITASLNARDKSGRINVRFGADMKTVVVSRRALLSVASPPRATEVRFLQHVDAFCEIVASGLGSKKSGGDVVLVTANDVRRWRRAWQSSEVAAGM
ncbi:hypothetical protein ACU8OR_27850 (plasmid) [Rhizobium leguminosarum]|jgi:hypothetical protein|uniref:hypothetical protein n=1 Tax=Rhizobium leguminosarum TaxID=384 RepID=UPI001030DB47|nr:hypothetical protein [Rhizobium leguminosarum]QIO75955.1 hypothetical protein HA459_28800 [Rhizobium leguminosarum bv. trifolii]QIO82968.1 hypothetical protein HA460_28835 [Rhizobium leguminosarum bv. trifolii]TAX45006.1 hypothetical protein ELH99_27525 [Rhizobium leguminosarum]TBY14341.1 hypothetical protein E0H30_35010 [Rhizobium leguminosarum bv. viciae]TBY17292.1 hypothetical protein E0H37_35475 [Rhizobium leguminosarum bv. viciae]